MTIGVFITWLVVGVVIGASMKVFMIDDRDYSVLIAALVGGGSAPVLVLVLDAFGLDNGFGVVLLLALTALVVKLVSLLRPQLPISSSPSAISAGAGALQEFEVRAVGFYDGSGHRLGPSKISVTNDRVIIDDARGGLHQLHLGDIIGVTTPAPLVAAKLLRIKLSTTTYDVYCINENQKDVLESLIIGAIRGGV